MSYYLGSIFFTHPATFWKKEETERVHIVLIEAESKDLAKNKMSFYTEKYKKRLNTTIKSDYEVLEAI